MIPATIPPWAYEIIVSFAMGLVIGMIAKHMLKFFIVIFIIVIILFAVGWVTGGIFTSMMSIFSPEITAVMKDPTFFVPAYGLSFLAGLVPAIWKM